MVKKLTVILLLCFIAILPVAYMANKAGNKNSAQILKTALASAGAQLDKGRLHAWGRLPKGEWQQEKRIALAKAVMQQLGIGEELYQLSNQAKGERNIVYARCCQRDTNLEVVIQSLPNETYLIINMEDLANKPQQLDVAKVRIKNIFLNTGSSAHITTCLTGWLDGKLEQDEFALKMQGAFQAVNAIILDRLEQPDFMSFTGFSPQLDGILAVGSKKTNINVAIRYSPYDDRTYMIVGSPVITEEY